jgi:sulfur carrier protein ThiS
MSTFTQEFASDVNLQRKRKNVYFKAEGLKPNSTVKAYINDVEITDFVLETEVIQIEFDENDPNKKWKNWIRKFRQQGRDFKIIERVGSSNKVIAKGEIDYVEVISLNSQTGLGVANVHLYVDKSGEDVLYNNRDTERVITSNNTFLIVDLPGKDANNKIIAYYPKFSAVNVATSNTIQLTGKVTNSEIANTDSSEYIVGKTIHIISGEGAGQNAVVQSYNTSTRTITVENEFDLIPGAIANTSIRKEDRSVVRLTELKADSKGTLSGVIMIPAILENDVVEPFYGWKYWRRWKDWNKRFKVYKRNVVKFVSQDFSQTESIGVDDTPDEPVLPTEDIDSVGSGVSPTSDLPTVYSTDPFAQTFIVDDRLHPQGVSLTSIRLLFEQKDEEYPIHLQIRPTTASIPDSSLVVRNGSVYINPEEINLVSQETMAQLNADAINPFSSNTYYSEGVFNAPVFLEPGKEYALVISSASSKHKIYTSSIGQNLLGTNRLISSQPYLGVLYKMQNTSVWEPFPNEDLCFELTKASFNTSVPATVDFYLKSLPDDLDNYGLQGITELEATAPESNVNVHGIFVSSAENKLANTKIDYSFRTTRLTGQLDNFKKIDLETTYEFDDTLGGRVVTSNNQSFVLRAQMFTNNPDVAPTIDVSRLNLITIENVIDDNVIKEEDILITNNGQDYSNSQNVIVTISGGGGTGAAATANVVNGIVDRIILTSGGFGYTGSPTITISNDETSTIQARAVIIGEDQPNGGIADAKYITRRVTLADGFDAGDLRVLFTAYKPRESEIDVYYKVLSADDADNFENKRWTLMTCIGGISSVSINQSDLKNYIYAPGKNNLADNYITYDGFPNFKYFAIKVVMRSTNPTKVPKISNFRTIALSQLLSS